MAELVHCSAPRRTEGTIEFYCLVVVGCISCETNSCLLLARQKTADYVLRSEKPALFSFNIRIR